MRKILLLVNPVLQRTEARRREIAAVVAAFRAAGSTVDATETGEHRAAGSRAKRAVAEGCDAIVVCGGDGTIFDVIQGMAGSSVPLGVVPFGTGNILAQNLKTPSKPVDAARWLVRARPVAVPLAKITCCGSGGRQSWLFATSAGMGVHASLMSEVRRSAKDVAGRTAYFVAGAKLLLNHPIQPFDVEMTTTEGEVLRKQVCEALAARVAELNRWRPGGGLSFPFLRLAMVAGSSRTRIAKAGYEALFRSAGTRNQAQVKDAAVAYQDVVRVVLSPIPGRNYKPVIAVQADGEVLGDSSAEIEMAGLNIHLLSANKSVTA
jgi:diacylglycerol kinase family enzyme